MPGGGQLGTARNAGFMDAGTSALTGHAPPGSTRGPTPAEAEHYAVAAARQVLSAAGGVDTHGAIGRFLGNGSFTAGVVVGMGQNLVDSAVELVKFLKMLALADYYQSQHLPGFWNKFSRTAAPIGFAQSPVNGAMAVLGYFWPDFDHQAQQAYEEREALIEAVRYAFSHPGEVFDTLTQAQVKRYEDFERYRKQHTLAGEYHAGVLFGELLMDLLMLVGAVAGLAKLAAKIPSLAKILPRLRKLVPTLKPPKKVGPLTLPKVEAPKAPAANASGRSPRTTATPTPAPKQPAPTAGSSQPQLHDGKQGKHIPGHNNFQPGKSELLDPNPQALLNRGAGTGQQVGNIPVGQAGSKERVDFGKLIGNYVDPVTGTKTPTANGIIHYGANDAHIVPARPGP